MSVPDWIAALGERDPSVALALAAVVQAAGPGDVAPFADLALAYRKAFLECCHTPGVPDTDLSSDDLREHLVRSVLPRLATEGWLVDTGAAGWDPVRPAVPWWGSDDEARQLVYQALLAAARRAVGRARPVETHRAQASVLEGHALCKSFKGRRVVDRVEVRVEQGEIVGLLGPNGAGKTTTFYLITGLIRPDEGHVLLDGVDLTGAPMYRRARAGIGYLAQEPSVFRKMTVEENILAILETRGLGRRQRYQQLEHMLDELSIKHLRRSKAYSLSGGERRRLEITRALVSEPKFMLLDEPFAGVDPIAVHDIQTIVAGLRHRGIGVLITDHNVEQTLDIVDRAYIMFEGKVQAAGTVRELVYDDRVAQLYLGPHIDGAVTLAVGGGGMKTGLSQHTSMRQELRVNPRLYQAMDMLYMPMMDLQQHLKQELLANPFLELLEPEDEAPEQAQADQEKEQKEQQEKAEEFDWEEILLNGFEVGGTREQYEQLEYIEPVTVETKNLIDHLREQLQMMDLIPRQLLLAEEFLGNINDEGYLAASVDEIVGSVNHLLGEHAAERTSDDDEEAPAAPEPYTLAEAEAMLAILQRLDPPGVGARDLRECLLIQLREDTRTDSVTFRLVDEAFPDLIAHRWNDLAKRFGIDPAAVQRAADELAKLDPKPGLKYTDRDDGYITPDLVVEKIGDQYRVFLNDTGMPRLRLSRAYQEVARDKKRMTQENREFIASKMNSANWMIQAIEQRRQTMLKVMNFIVDRQRDFFEKGVEYLKPLTLREVAEVINMHESTVSRVTNEKYVQTPRGVLPLKFFFSSALATASGEDASARSIRAKLQKMVGEENTAKPLTDQQIVHLFQEQGIQIARRTVAKYRDQLGILPARMRKRV